MYRVLYKKEEDACYEALISKIAELHGLILLSTSTQEYHRESFLKKHAMLFKKDELLAVLKISMVAVLSGMPLPTCSLTGLDNEGFHELYPMESYNKEEFLLRDKNKPFSRDLAFWCFPVSLKLLVEAIEKPNV